MAVVLAFTLALSPSTAAAPGFDVFEARAEAGGVHDSLAVPAYFETFVPYSLDEASNGSAHGYHSAFYGGFFLTAAGEQYLGEYGLPTRPPGTTETLYPQGPTTATAAFVPVPGADMGASRGASTADKSEGSATFGGGALGPVGSLGSGRTSTSVTVATVVRSRAEVSMTNIVLGPLTIGAVDGVAEALSGGARGTGKATRSLTFSDVRLGGQPVGLNIDDLGTEGPLDDVLAQAGFTITRLPDTRTVAADGTSSRIEVGGVKVTFSQPAQEFTVTWTLGRLVASARALPALPQVDDASPRRALPRIGSNAAPPPPAISGGGGFLAPSIVPAPVPAASRATELRRLRRTTSARGMDVTGIAAVIALVAALAAFGRRAFNAVASP